MWTPLAYLDPGSGSLVLQLLLGGIAGVAVLGRVLWRQIISFCGTRPDSSTKPFRSLKHTDETEKRRTPKSQV